WQCSTVVFCRKGAHCCDLLVESCKTQFPGFRPVSWDDWPLMCPGWVMRWCRVGGARRDSHPCRGKFVGRMLVAPWFSIASCCCARSTGRNNVLSCCAVQSSDACQGGSFPTWRCVRGPGWFCLWALDLVEYISY
ncbi:hypothetical protein Taro_015033, partial [Colocasia esculenta]|nr:hypothetical protein [Colocasia esculenta]